MKFLTYALGALAVVPGTLGQVEVHQGADEIAHRHLSNLIEGELVDSDLGNEEKKDVDGSATLMTALASLGDRLWVKGSATTCSRLFCPGCVTGLYVSLVPYSDSLEDPCSYNYNGQAIGVDVDEEDEATLVRPALDTTSTCFDYRSNLVCENADFDEEFTLEEGIYEPGKTYAFALSTTYQYQCQDFLPENKLQFLKIDHLHQLKMGGEEKSKRIPKSKKPKDHPTPCKYSLKENKADFKIDSIIVNDFVVV